MSTHRRLDVSAILLSETGLNATLFYHVQIMSFHGVSELINYCMNIACHVVQIVVLCYI